MTKKWAISFKRNVTLAPGANTKQSVYQALSFTPFRKFATRAQARAFKQLNSYRGAMCIVHADTGMVVR